MSSLRAWCLRFTGLLGKERKDRELAEELESHLQLHIGDNIKAGMNPAEARRDALIKLGGIEQTKENYRERRSVPFVESLLQDLRFGWRMLRKSPGFTAIAVLTLGLGIGANAAIFSIVNSLFLRPLPVRAPDQIASLAARHTGSTLPFYLFSYPALLDFQKQADRFSDIFGYYLDVVGFSVDGKASEVYISDVTGNYFSALGVKPALGRLIALDDDRPGIEPRLVLDYSFWQTRFGGSSEIVGKKVLIDGKLATIVGVAPKEFHGVYWFFGMAAYAPFTNAPIIQQRSQRWLTDRNAGVLRVLGRLKAGVTFAEAQSSLDVISQRLAQEYPTTDKGIAVQVYPERLSRPQPTANNLEEIAAASFLGLAVFVLLLACVNITNILLARATARRREMAIRAALGSGTGRLVRQMLTETVLLVLFGAVIGLLMGKWASAAIGAIRLDQSIPFDLRFTFDWRVFAYAFASAGTAGIVAGLWPAIRASRTDLNLALCEDGRSHSAGLSHHRFGSALVVAEIAASLTLLVVAGLFVRSLQSAERTYVGFDPDHVLNVLLNPQETGYDEPRTKELYRRLETDIRNLPGVTSYGAAYSVPMGTYSGATAVYVEGRTISPGQSPPEAMFNRIDQSYLETMRVPLARGRGFTISDSETAPLVALVNHTMANRFWPSEDPIGKRFSTKSTGGPFMQVVGVLADGKYSFIAEDPQSYFCVPLAQDFSPRRVLEIRSSVPPESLIVPVQETIHALDPNMPISVIEPMTQALQGGNGLWVFRVGVSIATTIGMMGLVLAVVGIYGVVSYSVSQRTREIGVRVSLGATPTQVVRLIVAQSFALIAPGVLIGLFLALAAAHAVGHLLFGVSPGDPLTYVTASFVLLCTALVASYIPARNATKVDPLVALRCE